jgi:hypothetical protein
VFGTSQHTFDVAALGVREAAAKEWRDGRFDLVWLLRATGRASYAFT